MRVLILGYNNPYSVTYYDVIGKKDGIQWNETGTEMVSVIRNVQRQSQVDMRRLIRTPSASSSSRSRPNSRA